jgi:two-component system, chemotaxis family, CheB/CheR fusion protein
MTKTGSDQGDQPPPRAEAAASPLEEATGKPHFPIVGVGASAGGLEAFTQLLRALPPDTGMAFVLVQHLAPTHPSALAEILARATKMPVAEVLDASVVEPNRVYVIPPGRCMVIADGTLQLLPRESQGLHRPVDQFFRALADDRRHRAIGVVLSGTASDGTLGLEAIKAEGGITFAQDATAQHEGMPDSAVASGCVDFVLPPDEIAQEIVRISQHPYVVPEAEASAKQDKPDLDQIVHLLHRSTGVDFGQYKFNTLYRRIARRMLFCKANGLAEYAQVLEQSPAEAEALYQDILIHVTSFFRDPQAFERLARTVFPRLLVDRSRANPVRIWTIGCSTGQEAYSLAIAFTEAAEAAGSPALLQIFATDLNAAAIETARAGFYSQDIAEVVSEERLRRFFVEADGGYRICKTIRDRCVFSRHNVLADPPFSRIDLVSCRNLLIYMEPALKQHILPMLHYALKPGGCLWLGGSETIGALTNLFDVENAKQRIFIRKPDKPRRGRSPVPHGGTARAPFTPVTARRNDAADLPREADRLLLHRFAPPGVVVSPELDILQYRGDTSAFLTPMPGKASLNLLKMLRPGLLVGVRAAIQQAAKEGRSVRQEGLRIPSTDGGRLVTVEVIPLTNRDAAKSEGFLVLFDAAAPATGTAAHGIEPEAQPPAGNSLEQELADTRDYLQSVIEQQEAANEELQSASEEVQSANEELQSTNEELETSKEEIQASNEELAIVNSELHARNIELHRANDDLTNLLGGFQAVVVMLAHDLRVRRFTPLAEKLFNLLPSDEGRRLIDIKSNLVSLPDLEAMLLRVRDTGRAEEHETTDKSGNWFSLRVRPYRDGDNKIDGVVLLLIDIDLVKRSQALIESIVATVPTPLLVLDAELRVRMASRAFGEMFPISPEHTVGRSLFELGDGQWNIPALRQALVDVVGLDRSFRGFEVRQERTPGDSRTMELNARRLLHADAADVKVLLTIEDITERKRTESALRLSEIRFRRLFEATKDGILMLDATSHRITHVNPFVSDLLGHPVEHFVGKELWEIGVLRDQEASDAAMRQLREQGTVRYENLPVRGRDGAVHPVEMIASEYVEADHAVIQCTLRDMADRHRVEALLRGHAAELSHLHGRKDEFLAMLGHELRSPLAPIANALHILGLERDNENRAQQQARVIIERQVRQLQHLVDDLLDVSRITTNRMQLRLAPVAASDVVAAAIETVRPSIDRQRHEVVVSVPAEPIRLQADFARLEQVLVNLLTNAVKFSNEGGRIWLTVERQDDQCIIRVRDHGIGIEPALLPHVFDLFTQGERSLDRSHGGLGIGLALVKQLTELHGGTVEVRSTPGHGSEFVVRLPTLRPDAAPPPAPVARDEAPSKRHLRVLAVDDNVDTVTSLSRVLTVWGHSVRTAHDGPAAIREALEFLPDVVLLDIGLPELNGFEVAQRLRAEPTLGHVVLVAMTGYGQASDRQKAMQAGFDHHMVKPASFDDLAEILANVAPKTP